MPPIKRRKPLSARKVNLITIRASDEQKRVLTEAAERDGLDLSSWLRSLGLREAQRQQGGKEDPTPGEAAQESPPTADTPEPK